MTTIPWNSAGPVTMGRASGMVYSGHTRGAEPPGSGSMDNRCGKREASDDSEAAYPMSKFTSAFSTGRQVDPSLESVPEFETVS